MKIFEMDSSFNQFMAKIADFLLLNILFILTSIPIITIGTAITALYHVWFTYDDYMGDNQMKRYLKAYKDNFKQSIFLSLLFSVIFLFYGVSLMVYPLYDGVFSKLIFVVLIVSIMIVSILALVAFPYLARFRDSTKRILINTIQLIIKHFPSFILVIVMTFSPLVIMHQSVELFIFTLYIYLFIGFSITTYLNAIIIKNVFNKYV